jgi:hypothetical protein
MLVWIESRSRWDALALARKLTPYHWYLVEPDSERWDVHVPLETDPGGELPADLRGRVVEWLDERGIDAATVHADTTDFVVTRA